MPPKLMTYVHALPKKIQVPIFLAVSGELDKLVRQLQTQTNEILAIISDLSGGEVQQEKSAHLSAEITSFASTAVGEVEKIIKSIMREYINAVLTVDEDVRGSVYGSLRSLTIVSTSADNPVLRNCVDILERLHDVLPEKGARKNRRA